MVSVSNPLVQSALHQSEESMKKAVEKLRQEFSGVRTGRASIFLLDNIRVEYYGSPVPLKQIAALAVPDGRTIEIKPWDASTLPDIEKAVHGSDLGLNPSNDGKVIRLTVPQPTEERRKELVKVVRKMAEEYRVSIRNERRDAMEKFKKAEKEKKISEDDRRRADEALQKLTDASIKRVQEIMDNKEKEVMEV